MKIKQILKELVRKFKYLIYIPRGISRKPHDKFSIISDLFPVRNENGWETFFELLNIPFLISGGSNLNSSAVELVFFGKDGRRILSRSIEESTASRRTLNISEIVSENNLTNVGTFALFHHHNIELNGAFLTERGYTGYKRTQDEIRGYVHGNYDSVQNYDKKISTIGNQGIFNRYYFVQHKFRGEALYEIFLTNPSQKPAKIQFELIKSGEKIIESRKIESRGITTFNFYLTDKETANFAIKSRLYLGRPVVFRVNQKSFDVFHG